MQEGYADAEKADLSKLSTRDGKALTQSKYAFQLEPYENGAPAPSVLQLEVAVSAAAPFLLANPDFSQMPVIKAYANVTEDFPLLAHEVWDLQQHHRTLISHLYVLLPFLFLTHQQEPYQAELGRVGRILLVNLLCLRHNYDSELPDWIHAQYFGHLWTSPVPGRSMTASPQVADWANTLSIWIHPSGTLSTKLGHREEQERTETTLTDLQGPSLLEDDEESQRLVLTLLHLLNTEAHKNPSQGDAWEGFMKALAFSGDLLTSLTYAVSHPLTEVLYDLSLRGVESLYRGFLEENQQEREEPAVLTMITVLISEGLLANVLDKTLLYYQEEGNETSTKEADLLLSLSLGAYTTDARVRMELSCAVHILSGGWDEHIQDLLIVCLQEALFKFPWIWTTAKRANIIALLLARVGSACHARPNTASVLYQGLREIMILSHLCQDYNYCYDVFNTPNHSLLTIVDNARLLQIDIIAGATRIGNTAQSIQFFCIDCVKFRTMPRPDDSQYGILMSPDLGWKIQTTWNFLLQTMLTIKSLPTENLGKPRVNHGTGLYTLHHLLMRGSCLTIQQRKNAWFILGREEIPDLYAHLICAQLHDTDRNAVVGMTAVLEGHTQAISGPVETRQQTF